MAGAAWGLATYATLGDASPHSRLAESETGGGLSHLCFKEHPAPPRMLGLVQLKKANKPGTCPLHSSWRVLRHRLGCPVHRCGMDKESWISPFRLPASPRLSSAHLPAPQSPEVCKVTRAMDKMQVDSLCPQARAWEWISVAHGRLAFFPDLDGLTWPAPSGWAPLPTLLRGRALIS